jgi:hypothetical protein
MDEALYWNDDPNELKHAWALSGMTVSLSEGSESCSFGIVAPRLILMLRPGSFHKQNCPGLAVHLVHWPNFKASGCIFSPVRS